MQLKYQFHNMFDVFQCRWRNHDIEKDVDFAQKIIRNVRSARATYNLPNKTKTDAYVACSDPVLKEKIVRYKLLVETLAYSTLSTEKPPVGCAIVTVTDKIQIHLLLKVINTSCVIHTFILL